MLASPRLHPTRLSHRQIGISTRFEVGCTAQAQARSRPAGDAQTDRLKGARPCGGELLIATLGSNEVTITPKAAELRDVDEDTIRSDAAAELLKGQKS